MHSDMQRAKVQEQQRTEKLDCEQYGFDGEAPSFRIVNYQRWWDLISAILSLFIPPIHCLWGPFIKPYTVPKILSPRVEEKAQEPTWQAEVSRIILIILLAVKVPLAIAGALIEWLLNFYYFNNGLIGLLYKVVYRPTDIILLPNPRDAAYYSVIGWMDQRTDLIDPYSPKLKVKPDSTAFDYGSKHFADLCIMASKIAYESKEVQKAIVDKQWNMKYGKFYECRNANASTLGILQKVILMVAWAVCRILIILQRAIKKFVCQSIPIVGSLLKLMEWMLHLSIQALQVLERWMALRPSTYAFTFMNKGEHADLIVLAFRGTEPFCADAWATDFDFSYVYVDPEIGRLHSGFLHALGLVDRTDAEQSTNSFIHNLQDPAKPYATGLTTDGYKASEKDGHLAFDCICRDLMQLLKGNRGASLVITGHSLGGALAALFAGLVFAKKMERNNLILEKLAAIYTFGQPRVGDKVFARFMESKMEEHKVQYYRVVYAYDIVPRVPFDDRIFGFKHIRYCCYNTIFYQQKALIEQPNSNFLDVMFSVVMPVLALWELVNGVLLNRVLYGDEFRDSGMMTIARVVALWMPGVVAHAPTNYVNAVRLGPSHLRRVPFEDTHR